MIETARRADRNLANAAEMWGFWAIIAALAIASSVGLLLSGTLVVPGIGAAIGIYFLHNHFLERMYRRRVQPALVELALEHGVTNQHLAFWLESRPRRYPRLARRAHRIAADAVLHQFAALRASVRVDDDVRAREQAPVEPPIHDLPEVDPTVKRRPKTPEEIARENRQTVVLVIGLVAAFAVGGTLLFFLLAP